MAAILKTEQNYRQIGHLDSDEEKALAQIAQGVRTYLGAIDDAVKARTANMNSNEIDRSIKGADKALGDALSQLLDINAVRTREASAGFRQVVVSAGWWIASLCIGIVLLSTLVAWIVTRSIVTPLGVALEVADRVAAGDLTVRVASSSRDEVGRLTRIFHPAG
jgi:methyl-accepting chemotaxis protein